MSTFTIHNLESAPADSKPLLEVSEKAFGRIPGLHAVMAESPGVLEAYQTLHQLFANSSFNADELTVVWQSINVEHECHYCVPAHTLIAQMMNVDSELSEALRNEAPMPNKKLQVLHDTTIEMLRSRGNVSEETVKKFFAAGYTQRQLLEIVLGLSQKVLSNYINHMAQTPLDPATQPYEWKKSGSTKK